MTDLVQSSYLSSSLPSSPSFLMGIDTAIINEYLLTHTTRSVSTSPAAYVSTDGEIVFVDLTEQRYALPPPIPSPVVKSAIQSAIDPMPNVLQGIVKEFLPPLPHVVTIPQICAYWFERNVERYYYGTNPEIPRYMIVLLMDHKAYVPVEKRREQSSRRIAAEKQGIFPYTHEELGEVDHLTELDPSRVPITSWLLEKIMIEFGKYLIARFEQTKFLCHLIYEGYDVDLAGPIMFDISSGIVVHNADYKHQLGEVDMIIPWYLQRFEGNDYSFVICIRDTDIIPITLRYLSEVIEERWPKNLYMIRNEHSKKPIPVVVNILELYREIETGNVEPFNHLVLKKRTITESRYPENHLSRQRVLAFVFGCILAGTDYTEKKDLSHWFNYKAVFDAVVSTWDVPKTGLYMIMEYGTESWNLDNYRCAMLRYIQALYDKSETPYDHLCPPGSGGVSVAQNRWKRIAMNTGTMKTMPIDISQTLTWITQEYNNQKRHIPPDWSKFTKALLESSFNWGYWSSMIYPEIIRIIETETPYITADKDMAKEEVVIKEEQQTQPLPDMKPKGIRFQPIPMFKKENRDKRQKTVSWDVVKQEVVQEETIKPLD